MREITSQAELDKAGSEWVAVKKGSFIAWGSSHVEAWGSSHVEAWESSHVEAWDFSSIVKLSTSSVIIKSGIKATVIIPEYPQTIEEWAELKGIKIQKGRLCLFKCVRPDGKDFYSGTINYLQKNKDIVDPLFDRTHAGECGKGLHLADSPEGAKYFVDREQEYLLLKVSARAADCIPFPGQPSYPMKIRARACRFVREIEKGGK